MTTPRSTPERPTALRRLRARGRPVRRPPPAGSGRPFHDPRRPWRLRLFLLASGILALAWDTGSFVRRARRGPWRVEVAGESMAPTLRAGDWLAVDPTPPAWPRRGTLVVVREPGTGLVVVKRLAARPGDRIVRAGSPPVRLGPTEAWLVSDAPATGIDSRRYGPVDAEQLLGRVAWRYGPLRRFGRAG